MTATDGKYVASFAYDAWIEIFSPHNNIVCQDVASFAYDAWIEISPSSRDLFISLSHRLRTMRGLKSAITLVGSPYPLVASFAYDAWIEIKFIRSSLSEKGSHRLRTMRGLK